MRLRLGSAIAGCSTILDRVQEATPATAILMDGRAALVISEDTEFQIEMETEYAHQE
jgi:hypothetical protein